MRGAGRLRSPSRTWRYEASFDSRYILTDPTLGPTQSTTKTGVFGLFAIREWRF